MESESIVNPLKFIIKNNITVAFPFAVPLFK